MKLEEINALIRRAAELAGEQPFEATPAFTPLVEEQPAPAMLAKYIDHTILKPEARVDQVKAICAEAREHHFASVCVNPSYTALVAEELRGSGVLTCCVAGFPFGSHTPQAKAAETAQAVADGAEEVDMVLNLGAVKSQDWALVYRDIKAVVTAAGTAGVKVILETCLLTEDEKVLSCALSRMAGAAFVKTSTGFSTGGATAEDITLMRTVVGPDVGVKASGGVRTYADAVTMLRAGANRLGASAGISIITP